MRQKFRLALLLSSCVLLAAADAPPTDVVARRGDQQVTVQEVRDALAHVDPVAREQILTNPKALADFVRDRLLRQVLLTEAHAAGWDQKPDIIARANDARDTIIMQSWLLSQVKTDPNYPSQAELQAAYDANKARFTVPTQYHVAQIAILVPANASKEADEAAHRKARDLRAQAVKPKADFAELAKKASQDKNSADRGGDLGWVREDQIVPAIRDAIKTMADNAISEPVRSPDAWHVVKLLGTRPPSVLPLDKVKDALANALRQARTQQATKAYLDEMLRKEPAQIDEIGLAARLAAAK